jgi:hypothetical protein
MSSVRNKELYPGELGARRRWYWRRRMPAVNRGNRLFARSRKISGWLRTTEIQRSGYCNDDCEPNFRFRIHLYPPFVNLIAQ